MSKLQITDIGTGAPATESDGVALRKQGNPGKPDEGFADGELDGVCLFYRATVTAAETATMSFLRLWGFSRIHSSTGEWYPIGPAVSGGTDADRGKLNNLVSLTEIASGDDKIRFTQIISELGNFERVYLQEGTSGGAGYASVAWLLQGR